MEFYNQNTSIYIALFLSANKKNITNNFIKI